MTWLSTDDAMTMWAASKDKGYLGHTYGATVVFESLSRYQLASMVGRIQKNRAGEAEAFTGSWCGARFWSPKWVKGIR